MSDDFYRTLAAPVEFRHKIERSEFLGIAFPVTSEEAFFAELARVAKRDFDATHHCWAFRLFTGSRARSSDAGEPSGTAGKPILAAIEGAALHDAAVIVVRWYGGIKLGTGGLARAYRETAAETLKLALPLDRILYERITVIVPFDALSIVWRLIEPPDILLAEQNYGERNEFEFDVRRSRVDAFVARLRELRLERVERDPGTAERRAR
ncbi:MAG TPA: YigZ family protein [Thermoanaerobaculia bacterium]|nr:YigZ family protein [Thermoanaerobaculia bacterium]